MLYFIPAWYQQNTWFEQEQIWYRVRGHSEFDDTVKQIQLFHRKTKLPYRVLLLSYAPNLRHFLHRQSIFHAPYWSCFDAIQEVERKNVRNLSYHDIVWPEDTEFYYTPFVIVAVLHGKKYAQVEFGEIGNPILVDIFRDDAVSVRNIYDDRGFVSSSVSYQDGAPYVQDFFTEDGAHKMRVYLQDGHVEMAPERMQYRIEVDGQCEYVSFMKREYVSLDELLQEVFHTYISKCTLPEDIFCEAMDAKHADMMLQILPQNRTILSFFEERFPYDSPLLTSELLDSAGYVVVDNHFHLQRLRERVGSENGRMKDISPYDTREDEGISQQLYVHKVMVPVDHLSNRMLHSVIQRLGAYALNNRKVSVSLFTRRSEYGRKESIGQMVEKILVECGLPVGLVREQPMLVCENDTDEKESVRQCFFVEQCTSELDVSKCMREQRILLDLDEEPELYLQVLAVSMGVPQICRVATEFLEPGKNGTLLKEPEQMEEMLDYYLKSLRNWNRAHIASYEVGKQFSTDVLLQKWKEVISYFERDSAFTDRSKEL